MTGNGREGRIIGTLLYFFKVFAYFNDTNSTNKYFYYCLKIHLMVSYYHCRSKKISLADDLRNVSENLEAEILNNLNSVKHILKGRFPLNFVSMKFKELLTEKSRDGLLLIKL